ncbi:MAG: GAF domain-containing protein [Gemmatimonadetes bacterium]|nr:GAF domain-containing protein [Gemmatimonadota bacterium]
MFDAKEVVRELQGMRDDGHLSDALLRRAVRKIGASDKKVSWAGVYLLNAEGNELWLHNYVGSPTEHAKIPVGQGVCGTAVAQKQNQNVPDVKKFENYLVCNPDVQSEMVVLIRAGDVIFGEIDIDSEEPKAFKDDAEAEVQAVADKLAEQLMAERR